MSESLSSNTPDKPDHIIITTLSQIDEHLGPNTLLLTACYTQTQEGLGIIYIPQHILANSFTNPHIRISLSSVSLYPDEISSFLGLSQDFLSPEIYEAIRKSQQANSGNQDHPYINAPITHALARYIVDNPHQFTEILGDFQLQILRDELSLLPHPEDVWDTPTLDQQGQLFDLGTRLAKKASKDGADFEIIASHEHTHHVQLVRAKSSPIPELQINNLLRKAQKKYALDLYNEGLTDQIRPPTEAELHWFRQISLRKYELSAIKEAEAMAAHLEFQTIAPALPEVARILLTTSEIFKTQTFYQKGGSYAKQEWRQKFLQALLDQGVTGDTHVSPHAVGALILIFGPVIFSQEPTKNFDAHRLLAGQVYSPEQAEPALSRVIINGMESTYNDPSFLFSNANNSRFHQELVDRIEKARQILFDTLQQAMQEAPSLFEEPVNKPLFHDK